MTDFFYRVMIGVGIVGALAAYIKFYPGNKSEKPPLKLDEAFKYLAAQDAEIRARGEIPETRLIPHHAIKRDVIIAAYTKDFAAFKVQYDNMKWTEAEKKRRDAEEQRNFEKHMDLGQRRLRYQHAHGHCHG